MPRPSLLLLLGCAVLACGSPRNPPTLPAEVRSPASGGVLRLLVGSEVAGRRAVLANTAAPLIGFGPFEGITAGGPAAPDADGCYRLSPVSALAGGDAEEIVRAWRAGVAAAGGSAAWLSDPLGGATGLDARGDRVVICPSRPTPDLTQRLRHPAAWIRLPSGEGGAGPFLDTGSGSLLRNPGYRGDAPFLERVELVPSGETDAGLWVRLGEVDLALLYGAAAAGMRAKPDSEWRLRRIPEWDRVYFLALDPGRRWTMDPSFRHWLSRTIDREGLLRYALAGEGEPAFALSPVDEPPRPPQASHLPFGQGSRPHLSLGFDDSDPLAAVIAARVQSTLELAGVGIQRIPWSGGGPGPEVSLHLHVPPTTDPVLGLWHTVEAAGVGGSAVARLLEQASRLEPGSSRRAAAWLAEDALLLEGEVVPLVRLHAWLAIRRGLRDIEIGPAGMIALRSAWWEP